ncbi:MULTISPECIES: hypothetical protein [unclassified Anabaena]|uniref:hypothetical protein n=1 Tax=unclassified Anabaena TaxID=2619674 RepID=UPI000836B1E0|nr:MULTISPECIES: hypothetical protein [unclassified Anabaena]
MIISDLNYLETANQEVFGGWGGTVVNFDKDLNTHIDTDIDFDFDSYIDQDFYKDGHINFNVDVHGNSATLAVDNEAYGYDTLVEAIAGQLTIENKLSSQYFKLVSAVD